MSILFYKINSINWIVYTKLIQLTNWTLLSEFFYLNKIVSKPV